MSLLIEVITPGQQAPDFEAEALDGRVVSLRGVLASGPALLVFYRGGWCPICNSQINSLSLEAGAFEAKGVSLVALSNEPPTRGVEVLKRYGSRFPLVYDEGGAILSRYGLRDPSPAYAGLEDTEGYARPACVLVDRSGRVLWSYIGDNPRDRPTTAALLAVIDEHIKPV
jgi:peroxiredoxin